MPIARGALYLMLQNRIYRGEIVHKANANQSGLCVLESRLT